MEFEWDASKAEANERKHGASFAEASTVFGDPMELSIYDPDHSESEHRFLSVGRSLNGRLIVVSYTEREQNWIRIISTRKATAAETKRYESEA